jgi:hypothetical protein
LIWIFFQIYGASSGDQGGTSIASPEAPFIAQKPFPGVVWISDRILKTDISRVPTPAFSNCISPEICYNLLMKKTVCTLVLLVLMALFPGLSGAQTGQEVVIFAPQTEDFPQISFNLGVYDGEGDFISGLGTDDIQIREDGNLRPLQKLQELNTGAQIVVAFNIAPPFAIRDQLGTSRYEYVTQALIQWAESLPADNQDDLSLLSNDGLDRTHLSNPKRWAGVLADHETAPRETASNLNVFSQAIDIASDPNPQEGVEKAILFLTPPPSPEGIAALQSLTSLALERQIHVFVWLISSPAYFNSQGAQQLQKTTQETEGGYFAFSGEQALPNPEEYFAPLRNKYRITYESQVTTPGNHLINVSATTPAGPITSERQFYLDVQPPNPIFVSPPLEITRKNPASEAENGELAAYLPQSTNIEIIIEFPDGYPRALKETTLYVDGTAVDTNTQPPFDQFTWNLKGYQVTNTHYLQVKVEDQLGLSKYSVETPVNLIVNQPDPQATYIFLENPLPFAVLGVVILAAILLLVLFLQGKIQPRAFLPGKKASQTAPTIPLPREEEQEPSPPTRTLQQNFADWLSRLSWYKRSENKEKPNAVLEPLTEEAKSLFKNAIPVYNTEIRFGNDPSRATLFLKDDSVSDLHAQLTISDSQTYQLQDKDSTAGTWVNYQMLKNEKQILQNGDIIHFGILGFRFLIKDPGVPQKVIFVQEEPVS